MPEIDGGIAMNEILADTCPSNIITEGDPKRNNIGRVAVYWIEGHCVGWWITARLDSIMTVGVSSDEESKTFRYTILEMKAEDC